MMERARLEREQHWQGTRQFVDKDLILTRLAALVNHADQNRDWPDGLARHLEVVTEVGLAMFDVEVTDVQD